MMPAVNDPWLIEKKNQERLLSNPSNNIIITSELSLQSRSNPKLLEKRHFYEQLIS